MCEGLWSWVSFVWSFVGLIAHMESSNSTTQSHKSIHFQIKTISNSSIFLCSLYFFKHTNFNLINKYISTLLIVFTHSEMYYALVLSDSVLWVSVGIVMLASMPQNKKNIIAPIIAPRLNKNQGIVNIDQSEDLGLLAHIRITLIHNFS